jgi:hypothetical protein
MDNCLPLLDFFKLERSYSYLPASGKIWGSSVFIFHDTSLGDLNLIFAFHRLERELEYIKTDKSVPSYRLRPKYRHERHHLHFQFSAPRARVRLPSETYNQKEKPEYLSSFVLPFANSSSSTHIHSSHNTPTQNMVSAPRPRPLPPPRLRTSSSPLPSTTTPTRTLTPSLLDNRPLYYSRVPRVSQRI